MPKHLGRVSSQGRRDGEAATFSRSGGRRPALPIGDRYALCDLPPHAGRRSTHCDDTRTHFLPLRSQIGVETKHAQPSRLPRRCLLSRGLRSWVLWRAAILVDVVREPSEEPGPIRDACVAIGWSPPRAQTPRSSVRLGALGGPGRPAPRWALAERRSQHHRCVSTSSTTNPDPRRRPLADRRWRAGLLSRRRAGTGSTDQHDDLGRARIDVISAPLH